MLAARRGRERILPWSLRDELSHTLTEPSDMCQSSGSQNCEITSLRGVQPPRLQWVVPACSCGKPLSGGDGMPKDRPLGQRQLLPACLHANAHQQAWVLLTA